MADVSDSAFRQMLVRHGKPSVMFTEFVSADGLASDGRNHLLPWLYYADKEKPLIMQVFGAKPENFYRAGLLAQALGFDGLDINMGCPQDNVCDQGAGASLINTPKLAQEIIKEAKRGAGDLPVSVKTRIGFNKIEIENWIPYLLDTEISALTIHGRTRKEMSEVPAHWDIIADAVLMAKKARPDLVLIGNGDIKSIEDGLQKAKISGVDGLMVGRGSFGNPWFFNADKKTVSLPEKLNALIEHSKLFEEMYSGIRKFDLMKKHFTSYVSGYPNVKKLKIELMKAENAEEVSETVKRFLQWKAGWWQSFKNFFKI